MTVEQLLQLIRLVIEMAKTHSYH